MSFENKKYEKQKRFSFFSSGKNYLRKGSAINKAIVMNILKKKYNLLVSDIPNSYSTEKVNH